MFHSGGGGDDSDEGEDEGGDEGGDEGPSPYVTGQFTPAELQTPPPLYTGAPPTPAPGVFSSAGAGATAGAPFGPVGSVIGGLGGLISGVIGNVLHDSNSAAYNSGVIGSIPGVSGVLTAGGLITPPSPDAPTPNGPPANTGTSGASAGGKAGSATDGTPSAAQLIAAAQAAPSPNVQNSINDAAENTRTQQLLKSLNPQANGSQLDTISISSSTNPTQQAAIGQLNDVLVQGATAQALRDRAQANLTNITALTPTNANAWQQYYQPTNYTSTAAQALAAQAEGTTVGPASLVNGNYQASLADINGYNPSIQAGSNTAAELQAQQMYQNQALGLTPSIAATQYQSSLDQLLAGQQAAAAANRGPNQALGIQAAARQAAQTGQQAVNQVAAARLAEQQAGLQGYANTAQAITGQQNQLATQSSANALQQAIQQTSAQLQNAQTQLSADSQNANAKNAVNTLQAQLSQQTSALNAQLANTVALQNAQMKTTVGTQNAANLLSANQYAGTQAMNALANMTHQPAALQTSNYGYGQNAMNTGIDTSKSAAQILAGNIAPTDINQAISDVKAAEIAKEFGVTTAQVQAAMKAKQEGLTTEAIITATGIAAPILDKVFTSALS